MAAKAPPPGSLRLTGGSLRGRRLAVPPGQGVRPTSDRARETLFNVLTNRFKRPGGLSVLSEARVLDAFAGTGALGLEALSRGAAFAAFAENSRAHAAVLQANIDALGLADGLTSIRATASAFSAEGGFGLILADPPYAQGPAAVATLLADGGLWHRETLLVWEGD
ncbi:MAG: RsmD family RNA methyltransferase, partial [Pseudomonadota bacterium]|nr:RsmD family RNA methyltransferase [Pseudomonadota bacterium]